MGLALSSSPKASFGLITPARDGSRFHLPCDRGSVWDFSITNAGPDPTDRASPKRSQPLFMPPEALLAASVFSRNECDDEAKPKTACGDDTNRLIKPACVQISTLLHARRHPSPRLSKSTNTSFGNASVIPRRRRLCNFMVCPRNGILVWGSYIKRMRWLGSVLILRDSAFSLKR
jgi:hypothetical protein